MVKVYNCRASDLFSCTREIAVLAKLMFISCIISVPVGLFNFALSEEAFTL